MIGLLAAASCYGGLASLALAMQRYRAHVWRRSPAARALSALQVLGALGLLLSLFAFVTELDWSIGLVSWVGTLTFASLALALALTYRSHFVAVSAAIAWIVSAAAAALSV